MSTNYYGSNPFSNAMFGGGGYDPYGNAVFSGYDPYSQYNGRYGVPMEQQQFQIQPFNQNQPTTAPDQASIKSYFDELFSQYFPQQNSAAPAAASGTVPETPATTAEASTPATKSFTMGANFGKSVAKTGRFGQKQIDKMSAAGIDTKALGESMLAQGIGKGYSANDARASAAQAMQAQGFTTPITKRSGQGFRK